MRDRKDITCNQGHGVGFSKHIDRCAFRDAPARGVGGYFLGEDNFTISAGFHGVPFYATHHISFKNTSDGGAYPSGN